MPVGPLPGLDTIRSRIASAGGDPDRIRICAVTKGFGADAVRAAMASGLADIGENYAQELVAKVDELAAGAPLTGDVRWHMIGGLQRNKVKLLAPYVHLWQSVDRAPLGTEIARWAPGAAVLVQVNTTGESAKSGCPISEVPDLVGFLVERGLEVRGLMTVGPTDQGADPRPGFEAVAAQAHQLGLVEVSMGMSADLEIAVAAGATMVRVGTALFGPRPRHATDAVAADG